ncbi:hypothetical protein [Enterococcus haemoperoxidus]|uniref:hypothetical protein n=1 Tax=Enterococcus haemoperoxidus TaxID=155618 RepID=UPI0003A99CFE|nr:hypothetical protein [Enterococcus haemoperoxidus]OJG54934.1 hypothetical protein RV06_GL002456 [Enterococcus haemoperoxidus]
MKKLTVITLLCSSILLTGCNNTSSKNAEVKEQPTEKSSSNVTPKTKEETSSEVKKQTTTLISMKLIVPTYNHQQ